MSPINITSLNTVRSDEIEIYFNFKKIYFFFLNSIKYLLTAKYNNINANKFHAITDFPLF